MHELFYLIIPVCFNLSIFQCLDKTKRLYYLTYTQTGINPVQYHKGK